MTAQFVSGCPKPSQRLEESLLQQELHLVATCLCEARCFLVHYNFSRTTSGQVYVLSWELDNEV